MRVLLLAGTAEARAVAYAAPPSVAMTASLAGATARPRPLPCATRVGGFGGVAGLTGWISAARIDAVIDATHPFAAQISAHAVAACAALGAPLLRIERPPWTTPAGARWIEVDDAAAAATALPSGARALLAIGGRELERFAGRPDVWCALRTLDPPTGRFPLSQGAFRPSRPPQALADELAMFRADRLSHLVAKNAGGPASAKIEAAAALGLTTVMVRRPVLPPAPVVESAAAAVAWLEERAG